MSRDPRYDILFEPVQIGQFGFHRLDQQFFRIRCRNSGEGDRDEDRRNFNVWLALFGKAHVSECAHPKRKQDERDDHARPRRGPIDDASHPFVSR